ncbi:hypothetical protein BKA56DRAFT_600084 [Ilyonectria sp. MPI-CAGE-AT-0026]|nr:hypothetical protein BKA56DRAFT_600084 [Ilyonectria sp. MPI-CAGE-AT-0026]
MCVDSKNYRSGLEIFDIEDGSCKTDRKPYDLAVCGVLLRSHQFSPDAIKIRYVLDPIRTIRSG